MRREALLICAATAATACGGTTADARDQWTVLIGTDAPLPQFGDRLLIEVLNEVAEPACTGCRRQLGVPQLWPVSFGIAAPEVPAPLRVRVRLYRVIATGSDGLPLDDRQLIDFVGRLPQPDGDTPVHVELGMSCFGVPADLAAASTCDPASGEPGPESVLDASRPLPSPGTWPAAQSTPCSASVPDDMQCVPGGVFLLGSPHFFRYGDASQPNPEHLTRLSPFALDRYEFKVKTMRALVREGKVAAPAQRGPGRENCTWLGVDDETNDELPVNCVGFDSAEAACKALERRLPTEAEWEYAAGNRGFESSYPWGNDENNLCAKAVVGRGIDYDQSQYCLPTGVPAGPMSAGPEADTTQDGVRDLAGNMTEWVFDRFSPYTASCWAGRLLVDPKCTVAEPQLEAPDATRCLRGSSWALAAVFAKSYARNAVPTGFRSAGTGFRCAKSM